MNKSEKLSLSFLRLVSTLLIRANHHSFIFRLLRDSRLYSAFALIEVAKRISPTHQLSWLSQENKGFTKPFFLYIRDQKFDAELDEKIRFIGSGGKREILNLVKLLKMKPLDQLKFIGGVGFTEPTTDNFSLRRTIVFDNGLFANTLIGERYLAYLESTTQVISSIYLPALGLVISRSHRMELESAKELLAILDSDPSYLKDSWVKSEPPKIAQVIHKPRPMHNIEQEIRGFLKTADEIQPRPNLFVHERAAFFEDTLYDSLGAVAICDTRSIRDASSSFRLYSLWWAFEGKAERDEWFWGLLKTHCLECSDHTFTVPPEKYGVFLTITSGEKRDMVNEIELLTKVVIWAKSRWGNHAYFVFDGWTSNTNLAENRVTRAQHRILSEIVNNSGIGSSEYLNLIGTRVEPKVRAASGCAFFLSGGSPILWPSKIAGIPGLVHGSSGALEFWKHKSLGGNESTRLIEPSSVQTLDTSTRNGEVQKVWHEKDYLLSSSRVLEILTEITD